MLLSTSNVRMSEGTFCRVEVHILSAYKDGCHHNNWNTSKIIAAGLVSCGGPKSLPRTLPIVQKMVNVGNDQKMAQAERNFYSKIRDGKN